MAGSDWADLPLILATIPKLKAPEVHPEGPGADSTGFENVSSAKFVLLKA
jgi:hypothetical protein